MRLKKYERTQCRYNSAEGETPSSCSGGSGTEYTSITDFSDNGVTCSSTYYGQSSCEYKESSQASCTGASASDCTQVSNLNTVNEYEAKTYDGGVTNCVYGICAADTITFDTSNAENDNSGYIKFFLSFFFVIFFILNDKIFLYFLISLNIFE